MKHAFFEYKNRPLVRSGDLIYYGYISDPYVAMLQVTQNKTFEDMTLATNVTVRLVDTDESKSLLERIIKTSDKDGLYQALDLADAWLTAAEKQSK
jgi:hypothetical protein